MILPPMLDTLNENICELIFSQAIEKKYNTGDLIVLKDAPFHRTALLTKGVLKAHLDEDDNNSLLYYISPSENPFICPLVITQTSISPISITAIEDCSLLWINNDKLEEWEKEYSFLRNSKIKSTLYNISKITSRISNRTTLTLEDRLYNYLYEKHHIYSTKKLQISRTEISLDLKVPLPSISRALKKLEYRKKLINRTRSIQLV
ncbi:Crp/Fnr family transcriptional regulator [Tenacibaculum sp. ZS6-P6]|uniref:Crp/Fnr family transcriptional regulator n=1 Tax=Tenacibaculum sp. ZS6-P6 TaxID=3447503 RepID=UPI003F989A81